MTKAPFQMTARRFANLSRARAAEHLVRYSNYLTNHTFLKPILAAKIEPEERFIACQTALHQNWMKTKRDEATAAFAAKKLLPAIVSARYVVKIYGLINHQVGILQVRHTRTGKTGKPEAAMLPMEYHARDYASAERLADRRLFFSEDAQFAIISNTDGKVIETRVERRDGIARFLAKPKHAVMKGVKKSSSLKWHPKSHATKNVRMH
jgi:hypothetical protein